jgi:hypothetical protein
MPTLLFAIACTLFGWVALCSPGYEDDIYNITIIEKATDLFSLVSWTNSEDVHPPLQYVFNYLLFHALGSWSLVRLFSALLTVVALFVFMTEVKLRSSRDRVLAFVLVILSSTLLLWTTGLRWYGYYVPFFLFTITWLRRNVASPWAF